jgi:glycosyltransferase involved in cell wall biosynthesis
MSRVGDAALPPAPFSVVLPAFDEERGLVATLDDLSRVLRDRDHEIIVVDDGSADGTPRVLSERSGIRVVRHTSNQGYGAALKAGIQVARHPLIVVMDADGTYSASAIPQLVDRCATEDMVVGARVGRHVHGAPARSAVKWCFRQFAQWITGARIPDLNSGLRAFRRDVALRFLSLLPDGFSFTTTITVAALLEGLAVRFEAVDYGARIGQSKIRPVRDTFRIARQLLRLGLRFSPLRTSAAVVFPAAALLLGSSARYLVRQDRVPALDQAWLAVSLGILGVAFAAEQRVRRRRDRTCGGSGEGTASAR